MKSIPYSSDIFQLVKEISTADLARRYIGINLNKRGSRWTGHCPFHEDRKSPSFVIYPDGGYKCFGCQVHGDGVDLVGRALGIKPLEAARQIARDHGIPLPDDTPQARREARRRMAETQWKARVENVIKANIEQAYKEVALMHRAAFRQGLVHIEVILNDVLDELMSRDKSRQVQAYRYAKRWWLP